MPPSRLGPWDIGRELGAGEFSRVFEATSAGVPGRWVVKLARVPPGGVKIKGKRSADDVAVGLLAQYVLFSFPFVLVSTNSVGGS